MRSLFIKIFIWFWLTMALANVAFFLTSELTRSQPFGAPYRDMFSNAYGMYGQTAVDTFEEKGPEALGAYMKRFEQTAHVSSELFNANGDELYGNGKTINAGAMVRQVLSGENREPDWGLGRPRVISKLVRGETGALYVLSVEPSPPAMPFESDFMSRVYRLLALVLTGGILCYCLALYLTSPVAKLRATTQLLASGDLTARVGPSLGRRRDELADLGRDFDVMVERVETLVGAQRRLLGDISHELRSPLARLSVALGLARRKVGREAKIELDRIEREADTINELIGHMLTLTKLESNASDLRKIEIDLVSLVQQIGDDADFEAHEKSCRVSIARLDKCSINGLLELIHSAVENVVRNAVKYTSPETEILISLAHVSEGDHEYAIISVRDHGPGVPPDAVEDIFKPFYRVADARDRESGGTGLGLAITARAVRLHGGDVSASNAEGGGLVVEIWLPMETNHFRSNRVFS